jgi:hypothetical protein
MENNDLIESLKKNTGVDEKTLIFDAEKAEEFIAEVQRENPGRIAFLPVRPDWNEAKKVFGYYNPLTGLFYPTEGLIVLLNAFRALMRGEKDKKHFIILDEMNLARVEYYFSDILSLMENMWKLKDKNNNNANKTSDKATEIIAGETSLIHPILDACLLSKPNFPKEELVDKDRPEKVCWLANKKECKKCAYYPLLKEESGEQLKVNKDKDIPAEVKKFHPIPPRIAYPENLVIIGTVNVDETTFSFAPKVLDRAFVLEFTDVYLDNYLKKLEEKEKEKRNNFKVGEKFRNFVGSLHKILKEKNMHFGYRVIKEMLEFLNKTGEKDADFDFLLKSKILPKLHGTEEQVGDILIKLLAFCAGEDYNDVTSANFAEKILENAEQNPNWWIMSFDNTKFNKYPDSAQKLWQMYQNMKATGYCSYF